ncbi:spore coat protein YlbD [Gracilibacillus phocaeensis]|uniref:spore coat protein YlbD n=1 Tax=Gracilibacillus phocaeensis TaxID=2042304 RepID=UPI001030C4BC|nr:spore coat protein YlbD [Gracilibacillus phocaeensis]
MNPKVKEFKQFIQKHPQLLQEVRNGKIGLQEAFEQYVLLGEDDPSWKKYTNKTSDKKEKDNEQLLKKLWKHVEQLDVDQIETHINGLSGAIDHVVTFIGQFKDYRNNQTSSSQHPFQHHTRD